MMSMDVIHVHVEKEGKHGKINGNNVHKQMTTYEQCMKVGVVLNPFTLNR